MPRFLLFQSSLYSSRLLQIGHINFLIFPPETSFKCDNGARDLVTKLSFKVLIQKADGILQVSQVVREQANRPSVF